MNNLLIVLGILCLSLAGCAEMGLKPHKPSVKSTREIGKNDGTFQIITIKASNPEVASALNNDLMSCGKTTFHMPRGNTVGTFIKEIYEQELIAAQKLSLSGSAIHVLIKSMNLETISKESGEWTLDIDYTLNDKTTNVKTIIEFDSKVSMLTSCSHAATVFEDAVADSLVEFFRKVR